MSASQPPRRAVPADLEERVRQLLGPFRDDRTMTVDALKVIQQAYGYVPPESLRVAAEVLGVSENTLDGILHFYEFLFAHPVGERIIRVCSGTVCQALGTPAILRRLRERLGIGWYGTTTDGKYTLMPLPCYNTCAYAPILQVDTLTFVRVTPEQVDEILDGRLEGIEGLPCGDGKPTPPREEVEL
jgi:NADH-quinone oxidoreductase subunit E